MEFKVERKVSFIETAYFEADSIEEAKEQLKGEEEFDWDVDFEYDPTIESVTLFDLDNGEEEELEADYMENDCVRAMNGCIIFNENEFRKYR